MSFYVYFLSNKPEGMIYIGVTNSLPRRIYEHKQKIIDGYSKKYNLTKLIYVEEYNTPSEAIVREKQLKNWHRKWKVDLIEVNNPGWKDLYYDYFGDP